MADPTDSLNRIVQTKGDISITPIVINLKSDDTKETSPTPRPRVQFSDKVERFPESVPTSPNPSSPKQNEPKKFTHEASQNGTPKIENVLSIKHNAPYSAGPHHDLVIEYEQLPKQENDNKIEANPTNNPEQSEPILTNVILNIEMVRTAKEHPPEDEDDETMARIAFSLPASNFQENPIQNNKTNQEQQLFKSANNEKDKTDQKENKSKQNLSGLEKVAKEIIESVVNELKEEKLQQIDLSPLLNKQLDNPDIAIINAEANRKSPTIAEPETNKNDETANKNVEKTNEKIVEIPIFILEKTEPFEHEAEIKRIHLGLPEFEDILGDYILTDKFIDIAIIFDDQNPSTSSEQNVGETKQAITKDQAASYVPTSKSTESASNKSQKEVDIVVHIDSENELNEEQLIKSIHKGFKVIEDLADEYISNDKFMDVFIVFENEEGSSRDLNNQSVQSPKTESDNIPTKSTGTSAAEKRPENQSALKEKLIEIAVFVEPETSSFDDEAVIKSIHKGFADAKELLEEFISLEKFVDIVIVSEDDSQSKKVGSLEKSVDISVITEPEIVPFNDETVIKKIHQGLAEVQELAGEFLSKDKFIEIPIIYADSDLSKDSINDKIVNTPPHVEDQSVLSHNQEIIKKVCQGEPPVEEIPGKYKPKERLSEIEIICAKNESTDELPEVLTPIPIIFEKDWTLPETEKSKESLKFQPDVSQSFGPAEANQKEPQNQYYDIQTIMEEEVSEYIDIPVGYIEEPMPYIDIPVGYIEEPIYFEVPVGYIEEPLYFEIPVTYDGKLLVDDEDAVKSIHKGVPLAKPLSDNAPSGPVEKFINIPIYFFSEEENKEEELKQENKIGEVHVPSETEKQKEADGVSYQSTFKKPLFEDNKPKNVAEKVEVKPEEVVFQSSFARPMSQEPSPIKKEAPASLETQQQLSSPFQKPLPQDQKEKSKSDEHSKPSKVSEPTTPEWQKPPQNSWLDSYDDGETIWDKPTSAEVHNIPIVLPTGKVQQGNEQANISQPSKTFVSPKDNILYYEVPAEGAKQQQISQPTSIHGASKADEVELNISEYEEQLKKNTKEALQLVDKLVESSQKIQQLEREKQKEHEKQRSRSRSSSQTRNVQFNENDLMEAHSYRVNPDLLKDANSIAMIPEFKIAIADFEQGLTLFNLYTKEIKRVDGGSKWRRPQSLIYNPRAKEFFVLVEYSENDDGKYVYYILRFSKDLEYINRVEAPVFIRDKDVSVFRLCYCHRTGSLYLGASTYANGYLYELSAEEKWIEIYNCRNKIFADVSVLAVVGPVTELIVLESTRSYANILSVYGTEATHVRSLAVCEKPGTLCIDETGHIIIHDKATSKICLHSRVSFLKTMEIALVDHSNVRLSAWDGLLAVLCPNKKDLRIYKY